jgi:hypothetical protein
MALARRDKALEFALHHHKNVRGDPLEFDEHFFILDILADPSPKTIIMSAVQTGKSESFIAKLMADCFLGLSCFYVLPSQDSRGVFVHNRIDRLFNLVGTYGKMLAGATGSADSVTLKHIGRGVARFGASESLREFKEFPADVLYVDEYDVCDPSGLAYAYDRCKGSPFRFTHYLSNPSLPGSEYRQNIDWLFQNSDAKKLHYRCPHCGLIQPLEWVGNIVRKVMSEGIVIDYQLLDEAWSVTAGRDILPGCSKCGLLFQRGECCVGWIPTGDADHPVSGYHLSRLSLPSDDVSELYASFRAALANPTKMQTFFNSDLGLPYEGGAGNKITEELMGQCAEGYELPNEVMRGPCTMGIDVGANYDVRISDYIMDEIDGQLVLRRRLVFVGKVPTIEEVHQLVERYRVVVAVIDAEPELHIAKAFQTKARCRVWRCQYHPTEGTNPRPVRWDQGTKKKPNRLRLVWIDRTEAMDSVYAQYVSKQIIEPRSFTGLLDGKYMREMTGPVRVQDEATNRFSWIKCVDHSYHANVYDWLASQDPYAGLSILGTKPVLHGTKRDTKRAYSGNAAEKADKVMAKHKRHLKWKDITG